MVPFDAQPADVVERIANYLRWMRRTDTPMLYLYALPGAISGGEAAGNWSQETVRNLEVVYLRKGGHFLQEDQPHVFGQAIAAWLERLEQP